MASDPLLMRAGRVVLGACLIAAASSPVGRAAETSARIALLAAGQRASVVIEFDGEVPKATAIEAPDSRSVAVEIGPVHSTIANQLLQATKQSPLVSEVRVQTVPQGAQGTLITLHVTAKTAVSGLVRRAQRRIYIDLEPLSVAAAPGRAEAAPDASGSNVAAPDARGANPSSGMTHPSASAPSVPQGLPVAGTAASMSSAQPSAASPTAAASPSPPAAELPADQIQRRAESLARQMDVKSLEKLKADLIAGRSLSASDASSTAEALDPVIAQIDEYLDEARKGRLLTDARMFKGSASSDAPATTATSPASPPPASSDEAFHRAIVPLASELQTMNAMLSQWQPGFVPSPNLPQSLEALTIRLRALSPPPALTASHERLCVALGALAKSWVPGPDGVSLMPVGNDARLIMTAKAALYDYLQGIAQQESAGATGSAAGLS